jgi:DMSO/TMAO reductase YedYZ molybdopterin-dependent catalytic subunit
MRQLVAEHGGPARLPGAAFYFWKSAKWIRGPGASRHATGGFWEATVITYGDLGASNAYELMTALRPRAGAGQVAVIVHPPRDKRFSARPVCRRHQGSTSIYAHRN